MAGERVASLSGGRLVCANGKVRLICANRKARFSDCAWAYRHDGDVPPYGLRTRGGGDRSAARADRGAALPVGPNGQPDGGADGTGRPAARRKHRLAECLLVSVIKLPWEEVHIEACRWEHVISENVERRLFELLGYPDRCPHGNLIPGLGELVAENVTVPGPAKPDEPMTDVVREAIGTTRATVTRITEQIQSDLVLMLKLKRAGIQPGREVLLGAVEGGVRVSGEDGGGTVAPADLPAEVASHVFVSRE